MKLLIFASLVVVLLAGCGAPSTAPPTPAVDRFGAPVPMRFLDATASAAQPCSVLSVDQLRALGVEPNGRLDPLPTGVTACVWEGPGFTREVSAALYPRRDFLVDAYRSRGVYQRFQPVTVGGFPAAVQQSTTGGLSCTVTTAIAVGQAVDVSATELGANPGPPCETALRISEVVVGNLPAQPQK